MSSLTFVVGKGGVGKTTISSAYAVHQARRHARRRILLLSTDPAHSLGDVLLRKLSDEPQKITPGLYAREIDAAAVLRRFLADNRQQILAVIERGSFFSADDIGPLLDATLPGMAELAGLLAVDKAIESGEWDEIVVDTAPMGHTLRMLELPTHFLRILEFLRTASQRDEWLAQRFSGRRLAPDPFVVEWQQMVERLRQVLRAESSRILLVTTPEPFAVQESLRAADWLAGRETAGLFVKTIVLNRAPARAGACLTCARRVREAQGAVKALIKRFTEAEILRADDPGAPLLGIEQLHALGNHVFERKSLRVTLKVPPPAEVDLEPAEWPVLKHEMNFTVGKGGVGKTTISAALAVHTREKSRAVLTVCSTDPAPSLDDVFEREVGNDVVEVLGDSGLRAAEIDAVGEYRRWADAMRAHIDDGMTSSSGGLHLDMSYDREMLDALLDVVPPGVDEVFAILRISDMMKAGERIVVDMAPTGHALELLRTPERLLSWTRMLLKTLAANRTLPLARDAGVEVATIQHKVRELARLMHDAERSTIAVVMLAEPLPDRETRRLMRDLAEMGSTVSALFVNRVTLGDVGDCRRCSRAQRWQMSTLQRMAASGSEVLVTPEVLGGVSGRRGLKNFTTKLWRLA